jgi:DNA-binding CsgD family transcriptional regulator
LDSCTQWSAPRFAGEGRVGDLAAAGLTNRDIAQELFVTPKTVERDLGNVHRKLGISSRHRLGSELASQPGGRPGAAP